MDPALLAFCFIFGLSFKLGINRRLLRKAEPGLDQWPLFCPGAWVRPLVWQYGALLIFTLVELVAGESHGQVILDLADWVVAFVAIDLAMILADILTLISLWRKRRSDK